VARKNRLAVLICLSRNRAIVATEQGGIALRDVIFAYKLGKDGKTAAEIEKRITFPNSACADATKLAGR
jgi:hypothetical protein